MATWLIHLLIAKACENAIAPESLTDYAVGAIAPDGGIMLSFKVYEPDSSITHWTADGRKRNSDYNRFYDTMLRGRTQSAEDRSFLLGYFVHLMTDNLWCKFLMRKYEQQYIKTPEDKKILGEGIRKDFLEYESRRLRRDGGCDYVELLRGIERYSNKTLDYLTDGLLNERITATSAGFGFLKNEHSPYELKYTSVREIDETISLISQEIIRYVKEKCGD